MILDDFESGDQTTDVDRARAARQLTEKCGYAAAALTILPIPGTELVAVMPLHVGMVVGIGHVYGVSVSRDSATQLILRIGTTVGASLVGSRIAMVAGKLILPAVGGLIAAPFMYASTVAIGTVARCWFERGELSDARMRAVYRRAVDRARRGFDPSRARSAEARDAAEQAAAGADEKDDE